MKCPRCLSHHILTAIFCLCCSFSITAFAGKSAYQELTDQIGHDVVKILSKHGMPIFLDRPDPWFRLSAGTDALIGGSPAYMILFDQAGDIPLAAQLEVIQYCMELHESRGRREIIHIRMRTEAFKPGIEPLRPKPYFELILNNMQ